MRGVDYECQLDLLYDNASIESVVMHVLDVNVI